jgi:Na+/H+-dicarboxylate symporter
MPFIPRAMALVFLVTLRSLNFEHIVIFLVLAIDDAADELRCSTNSNLLYGAGIRPAP